MKMSEKRKINCIVRNQEINENYQASNKRTGSIIIYNFLE